MAREIFRDKKTGEYTMKEKNSLGVANETIVPAKFSPDDKYAKYRRIARDRESAANTDAPQ